MTTYSNKLKDPRWQRKRLEILSRDNFTCQFCGDDKKTLHVHHKKYKSPNPWESENHNLITLCEVCHDIEHKSDEYLHSFIDDLSENESTSYIKILKFLVLIDKYKLWYFINDVHGREDLMKYLKDNNPPF